MNRLIVAALLLGTLQAAAQAAPCKDARGKFVKCGKPGAKPIK